MIKRANLIVSTVVTFALVLGLLPTFGIAEPNDEVDSNEIDLIVANMSLDEKISQLIIPAIRTWDTVDVTSLDSSSALAEALRAHQYGGIILFGANLVDVEQTGNLVNALQANNMDAQGRSKSIPYLMCVDGEGGSVVRFSMGTRMTGNMAIGATGANAQQNAQATGRVLGEEIAALGFSADLAPSVDVNSNPANPVIGTRSFSDDPNTVGLLGTSFQKGLAQSNVIATYKHFPGHGDTATDSHIGTPAVNKTEEQLEACELVPFRTAIANGADMIMTAHITLPLYDDTVTFADGTEGNYPATMSHKIISTLLRNKLGYEGVVITDALEMDALYENQLVEAGTPAPEDETKDERKVRLKSDPIYCANLAEKIINAGCDILLLPTDLNNETAKQFYDTYISAIEDKVGTEDGKTITVERIDQSVRRILELKQEYGILDEYHEVDVTAAKETVGSAEHHETEKAIAQQAITLVKNDNLTLPISGLSGDIVLLGRLEGDNNAMAYAVQDLQAQGLIPQDAYVQNFVTGTNSGSKDSSTHVTIDYYCGFDDKGNAVSHYTDELKDAIANADTVVCFTASFGTGPLASTSPLYQSVSRAIGETHAAGGTFVLMANNLPYDAARYQDADAIVLGYLSSGISSDPTDITARNTAYNANVIAGLEALFDNVPPTGTLPVGIPTIEVGEDGSVTYTSDLLYQRGHGLTYSYAFVEGAGASHKKGSDDGLAFKNNARLDKLVRVLVDDVELSSDHYQASAGPTNIALAGSYLNTLEVGDHTLAAVYNYGSGEFTVDTSFAITKESTDPVQPDKKSDGDTSQNGTKTSTQTTAKTASTGDSSIAIEAIVLLLVVAVALVTIGIVRKRR